jgi:thioester reductase-like protein
VVAVPGDLTRPAFGLTDARFRALADGIDTIVHAGATVNLVAGYAALRGPNVGGVLEVLRLAALGRSKRLLHLSTLGVLDGADLPADGYSQSKWVAESLLAQARGRGVPSTVVRLGEVMAHAGHGEGDERSVLTTLLRVSSRLGLRFATPAVTDWTPVDLVCRVIVDALRHDVAPPGAVHLVAPGAVRLEDVLRRLARLVPLRVVDYPTFWSAVDGRSGSDGDAARLLALLPTPDDPAAHHLAGLVGDATVPARRQAALAERLVRPDLDAGPLDAYLRWVVGAETTETGT